MQFLYKPVLCRSTDATPLGPHLRRDSGLPEIDRSDWLVGRQIALVQGWS